eukprot:gene6439-10447_t
MESNVIQAHYSSTKGCKYLSKGNEQKTISEFNNASKLYEEAKNDTIDETTLEALKLLSDYNKSQAHFLKNKPKRKPKKIQIQKPNASYTPYDDSTTKSMFINLLIEPWDSFYEKLEDESESQELKEKFITTMNKVRKNALHLADNAEKESQNEVSENLQRITNSVEGMKINRLEEKIKQLELQLQAEKENSQKQLRINQKFREKWKQLEEDALKKKKKDNK